VRFRKRHPAEVRRTCAKSHAQTRRRPRGQTVRARATWSRMTRYARQRRFFLCECAGCREAQHAVMKCGIVGRQYPSYPSRRGMCVRCCHRLLDHSFCSSALLPPHPAPTRVFSPLLVQKLFLLPLPPTANAAHTPLPAPPQQMLWPRSFSNSDSESAPHRLHLISRTARKASLTSSSSSLSACSELSLTRCKLTSPPTPVIYHPHAIQYIFSLESERGGTGSGPSRNGAPISPLGLKFWPTSANATAMHLRHARPSHVRVPGAKSRPSQGH
jgi:hypothetical protein